MLLACSLRLRVTQIALCSRPRFAASSSLRPRRDPAAPCSCYSTPTTMADSRTSNTAETRAPRKSARREDVAVRAPKRRSQKPDLVGQWQPTLPSRMGARSKGCGHYVWGNPLMAERMAAFGGSDADEQALQRLALDLDGTVIQPKDGKAFPKDSFDWQFCSPLVVPKLRELHRAGYSLVLISNQASSNPKLATDFRKKVPYICRKIGVPLHVYACWDFDEYRKPAPGMWHAVQKLVAAAGSEIDYTSSFYVGDAAGRRPDHADTDRKFALNAGLRFMTPEELFAGVDPDPDWALWGWNPFTYRHTAPPESISLRVDAAGLLSKGSAATDPSEVVLLVGAPASGKTHHWRHTLQPQGYQLLEFETERGFAVPLHVQGWLQQQLDAPVPISGSEAPLSSGPPPSVAPARLVLSSSFPSRHSRRSLLAHLRTTYPHAHLRAIVFSPVGGFDAAASGKGGVELWKHNSVWRMAYQPPPERNDPLDAMSLVPIEAFKKWERDWEEPTLDEGFDAIEQCFFGLDPARTSAQAFAAWHQWLADVYPGKAIKTGRVAIEGPGWTGIRSVQS